MTDPLKQLLSDFGILTVSLAHLESERPSTAHATLKAYYDSLGPPLPDEPYIVVRISPNDEIRLRKADNEEAAKYASQEADVSVLELPEDEFYFFQAFRPALFDLEKRLPLFLLRMAFVYAYTLFEDYLSYVVRRRLMEHPRHLGEEKQVSYGEVLESESLDDLIARLVDRELRQIMYLPVGAVLEKLRSRLGFRKLSRDYDQQVVRLSLLRNAIVHNGARVTPELAAFDATFVTAEEVQVGSKTISEAIRVFRRLTLLIDQELQ